MNVLITAASRRVPLVQAFQSVLRIEHRGRVIVTDVDPSSPAVHVAHRAYRVPLATHPEYIDALLDVCVNEEIGLLVPTVDDELEVVARARVRFTDIGVSVACSPDSTAALCNDKYATCHHLADHGVEAARTWLPGQIPDDAPELLFIKPRVGRGGVGAFTIRNRRERDFFLEYVASPVVQEYLQAPEYTIDMLCDWNGEPIFIVPRERTVIRSGVIDRGRTVKNDALQALALAVAAAMRFQGPVNIQCRMRGDVPVVFEINPRFSGGIPLTIAAGRHRQQHPREVGAGGRVEPAIGAFREHLWMTNYESSLFLEPVRIALPTLSEMTAAEVA